MAELFRHMVEELSERGGVITALVRLHFIYSRLEDQSETLRYTVAILLR